jgi:GDPmannose 4,6-dehydratase
VPTALITGAAGQDGSYLSELLLAKGYVVVGGVGAMDRDHAMRILDPAVDLRPIDLLDAEGLRSLVRDVRPDELYHLAAPSQVQVAPGNEAETYRMIALATHALLSAIAEFVPACRFFHAGSSEMFGRPDAAPQNETTPFRPRAFYGVAKLAAHEMVRFYRDIRGLYACTGIMFNHESPRRAEVFVTRKITRAAARIKLGLQERLGLGDLSATRDWGYAPEYVNAMRLMLQGTVPRDFVVASGRQTSVGDFARLAFAAVDLDSADYVEVDQAFVRSPEAVPLVGDASAIREALGWIPETSLEDVIAEMVEHDISVAKTELKGSSQI